MRQLAQQEAKLVLIGLALADIDGDRRGADNGALLVSQRLDHEIEGALPPEQFEMGLELLRGPGLHRLALGGEDGVCGLGGENLRVGLADELFGRETRGRVVHPGKTHLLVLAKHGDGRAAERDLDAPFRLGKFLGARLDAFFKLMPRFLQRVGRLQMRGDFRLQAVARGNPRQARCDPPEKKCNGAGERGARNLQDGRGANQPRQPKRGERDQMRKADRDHEKRAERDHGHHVRTISASLAPDVDHSGGNGEEGECKEKVGQEIEPLEP